MDRLIVLTEIESIVIRERSIRLCMKSGTNYRFYHDQIDRAEGSVAIKPEQLEEMKSDLKEYFATKFRGAFMTISDTPDNPFFTIEEPTLSPWIVPPTIQQTATQQCKPCKGVQPPECTDKECKVCKEE